MQRVKFWGELFWAFFKVGLLTIGGGHAMLPIIEREIVREKKWMDMNSVVESYSVAQSLPGVVASNTAIFIGYKLNGVIGAIVCALGVITPSIFIIIGVVLFFRQVESQPIVQKAFKGIRIMVLALLIYSMERMRRVSIRDRLTLIIAVFVFLFVMLRIISPISLMIIAGALGVYFYREQV